MKKIFVIAVISASIISCRVVIGLTDSKKNDGELVSNPISKEANDFFWAHFHQGNYDSISAIIGKLNLALAEDPNDLISTAHLGFVHVWALSERQRLDQPQAGITEHLFLSRRYFEEAYKMNPNDPRLLGFLADMTIAEGDVLGDRQIVVDGFFKGLKSIRMWPQFNQFSIGYVFSNLDTSDANYLRAIAWQYETISDCACEKVKPEDDHVEAIKKIKESTNPKIARACWNSWIAPHNWEGFCLNFGDMLTKKGDLTEAERIYNLARLSDDFDHWPFKPVLEKRINAIASNAVAFNLPLNERKLKDQSVILFNGRYACVSCHQMSDQDYLKYQDFEGLTSDYYFPKKDAF